MKKIAIFAVLLVILGFSHAIAGPIPLPNDIQIIPPDHNLPEKIKALSGKWGETWYSREYHYKGPNAILIAERVEADKATIIYGWQSTLSSGWIRKTVEIYYQYGRIYFNLPAKRPNRAGLQFYFDGNKLYGEDTFQSQGGIFWTYEVIMKRIP